MVSKVKKRYEILSDNSTVTDEEIIKDIFAGRVDYFEYLMRRYNSRFYRIARSYNIKDPYCDKLIRDSFLMIYANLKYFNGMNSFSTWATRIHLRHCKLFLENWKKYELGDHNLYLIKNDVPQVQMVRKDINKVFEKGISKLPVTMRLVFVMKEIEHVDIKQIASYLNITDLKAKICYFRAKLFLKKYTHKHLRPIEIFPFVKFRCDELVRQVFIEIRQLKIAFAYSN